MNLSITLLPLPLSCVVPMVVLLSTRRPLHLLDKTDQFAVTVAESGDLFILPSRPTS